MYSTVSVDQSTMKCPAAGILNASCTRWVYRCNGLVVHPLSPRCSRSAVDRTQPIRGLISTTSTPEDTQQSPLAVNKEHSFVKVTNIPAPHTGHIRIITLNSPHNKNALSRRLLGELDGQVRALKDQSDRETKAWYAKEPGLVMGQGTRAVVFGSEVDGVFCAGADLKERAGMSQEEYVVLYSKYLLHGSNTRIAFLVTFIVLLSIIDFTTLLTLILE